MTHKPTPRKSTAEMVDAAYHAWFKASHDAAPSAPAHPDDTAVDRFAERMKSKMERARHKGRSGWEECSTEDLSTMLRHHVAKGDPTDVANFCMMLEARNEQIGQASAHLIDCEDHGYHSDAECPACRFEEQRAHPGEESLEQAYRRGFEDGRQFHAEAVSLVMKSLPRTGVTDAYKRAASIAAAHPGGFDREAVIAEWHERRTVAFNHNETEAATHVDLIAEHRAAARAEAIEALKDVRAAVLNENGLNDGVLACTLWASSIETVVDRIDRALNAPAVETADDQP